jgi:hypothetical protein
MSDTPLDSKAIEQLAEQKAQEKMDKLKENLVSSLSGTQSEKAPESWSALKNETVEMAVKAAEEKILSRVKADREEEDKKREAEKLVTEAQTKANADKEWAEQSAQWREAVNDGIIPDIKPEVAKAVEEWQKGGTPLTPEQYNDPGLKAFREAKALHDQMKAEGKSSSFYRTIEKFYNKKPAGAAAPVLGGSRAVAQHSSISYDEIHRDAMRRLRHRHG